jgi:hypothetical protein
MPLTKAPERSTGVLLFIDPVRKNTTHQSFKKGIGIAE